LPLVPDYSRSAQAAQQALQQHQQSSTGTTASQPEPMQHSPPEKPTAAQHQQHRTGRKTESTESPFCRYGMEYTSTLISRLQALLPPVTIRARFSGGFVAVVKHAVFSITCWLAAYYIPFFMLFFCCP
jgi:hypothetical protein